MLFFNNKRSWILCGITFLAAGAVFPFLPKQIPVHWSSGMADGFAEKWAVFLFPALQAGILLISQIPGEGMRASITLESFLSFSFWLLWKV